MKKKEPVVRSPRRNKQKERIEVLEHHLRQSSVRTELAEKESVLQGQLRTFHLLAAERDELLARAQKLDVILKSMGVSVERNSSPASFYPVQF